MNCEINVSSAKTIDREGSEKCEKFSVPTISYCAVCGYSDCIKFELYWSFQVCFILGLIYKMSKFCIYRKKMCNFTILYPKMP